MAFKQGAFFFKYIIIFFTYVACEKDPFSGSPSTLFSLFTDCP